MVESIEQIIPSELPPRWELMPRTVPYRPDVHKSKFIRLEGDQVIIWPENGRHYLYHHSGRFDGRVTQLGISIAEGQLIISVSDSYVQMTPQEAKEIFIQILPKHADAKFIPQETINKGFKAVGVNERVAIGEQRALIQYFEKDL